MTISENGLRNRQQQVLVNAAREALDSGRCIDALSLAERVPDFWTSNLITILGVFCAHPIYAIERKAFVLFKKNLTRCQRSIDLVPAALWLRNPKRSWLPRELRHLVDDRRKVLEPDWNGIWENPGLKGSKMARAYQNKSPREIHDPDTCLIIASQVGSGRDPWLVRYLILGGSASDVRYLKIKIISATKVWHKKPSPETRRAIRQYCENANASQIRKLLRSITPSRNRKEGRIPPLLARYALLVYCSCEKLKYSTEDWVHIAESSIYLRMPRVRKIAQRGLACIERTPSAQRVFENLIAIDGEIPVTNNALKDIGFGENPIWQSVYHLLPIDANAKQILLSYSRFEMEAL